jgi:DNA-binding protein HU-beta
MQKSDLIARVAKELDISKDQAAKVINRSFEVITERLGEGEKVTITGFGTFEVRATKARRGTNPRTKEPINIPASKRISFNAGMQLRAMLSPEEKK